MRKFAKVKVEVEDTVGMSDAQTSITGLGSEPSDDLKQKRIFKHIDPGMNWFGPLLVHSVAVDRHLHVTWQPTLLYKDHQRRTSSHRNAFSPVDTTLIMDYYSPETPRRQKISDKDSTAELARVPDPFA